MIEIRVPAQNVGHKAVLLAIMALIVSGCSSNMSRFDLLKKRLPTASVTENITRAEVADQGSGDATSPGFSLKRVTVGGAYLRRIDVTSGAPNALILNAGLYGNPRATQ